LVIADRLQEEGIEVLFCEPNICEPNIGFFRNVDFSTAMKMDGLFVIAQKHDLFEKSKAFFAEKNVMDFVGLFQ